MFCYDMYAYMLWAGRQYVMGRKAICYGQEGIALWAGRRYVLGPEGRGLERRICGWYFGGISLSFRAYSCGFMFQVLRSLWQGKGVIVPFLALVFYEMNLGNTLLNNVLKTFL